MKDTCARCGRPHPGCNGHRREDGGPCRREVIRGGDVCDMHGGAAPQVAAAAAVRAEVSAWRLDDEHVDPGEFLLRLVAQSARRVALYGELLRQAYEGDPEFPTALAGSGLAALVGHKYDLAKDGTPVAVEEALRGLVQLEAAERERGARWAKMAIDARLEKRRVELAESQGALIVSAIDRILEGLGLTEEQRARVPVVVPAALRMIEGSVAS